jgi:putative sigma-54 modulation protein
MAEKTKAEIKEKFNHSEYPIQVIGRHVSITDPMKTYAIDKLLKLNRFGGHILEATIVMDVQKLLHTVDFILDINNIKIKVSGRTDNMYASIDQAIEHLETKLRKYIRRIHEHKGSHLSAVDMNVNVLGRSSILDDINDQIEEENLKQVEEELRPHHIVAKDSIPLKTLNQEEAVLKMELSEDRFMIYRSEEDQKLKVIYRRNDGNYGVIEPEK